MRQGDAERLQYGEGSHVHNEQTVERPPAREGTALIWEAVGERLDVACIRVGRYA